MIKNIVIDPNGLCNAKCWFCPIAYEGNPKVGRSNMSIETLDNILKQIKDGVGDFVSTDKIFSYTVHYNETVLHPQFEQILETYKKYEIPIFLFSNGIGLNKEKIDIIKKNTEIIERITLNIPSSNAQQWSNFVGVNIKLFNKLLDNLSYAHKTLYELTKNNKIAIVVNGINKNSDPNLGGWTEPLNKSKQNNFNNANGDIANTVNDFNKMFPNFAIGYNNSLEDRAGILVKLDVLSNENAIERNKNNNNIVIGCFDNRIDEWIHISATGDVFICCEDFYFETSFGNIHKNTIKEIWNSKKHKDMIKKSMKTICTKCSYAKWGS